MVTQQTYLFWIYRIGIQETIYVFNFLSKVDNLVILPVDCTIGKLFTNKGIERFLRFYCILRERQVSQTVVPIVIRANRNAFLPSIMLFNIKKKANLASITPSTMD